MGKNVMIADLCCGAGNLLINICKNRRDAIGVGVDFSLSAIKLAVNRAKNENVRNMHFIVGDIEHLSLRYHTFDIILNTETIEHLASRVEVLRAIAEMTQTLKVNGRIIISCPHLASPLKLLLEILRKPQYLTRYIKRIVAFFSTPEGFPITPNLNYSYGDEDASYAPHVREIEYALQDRFSIDFICTFPRRGFLRVINSIPLINKLGPIIFLIATRTRWKEKYGIKAIPA